MRLEERLSALVHEREAVNARIVHELKREAARRGEELKSSKRPAGKDAVIAGYADLVRDIAILLKTTGLDAELLEEILLAKDDPELDADTIG